MMMLRSSSPSLGRSSSHLSNYARSFDLPDDYEVDDSECDLGDNNTTTTTTTAAGSMLPIFLNDLRLNGAHRHQAELLEITLELDNDSIVLCSVTPPSASAAATPSSAHHLNKKKTLWRSLSATSRIRNKFAWLRSGSSRTTTSEMDGGEITARDARKIRASLQRSKSSAERALKGLKFINKASSSSTAAGGADVEQLWRRVECRFESMARDGFLAREDFGECIGMVDSKEFAGSIFDALARRKRQRINRINKDELREFWLQITDHSFDARLQIFFDMADSNDDGRITREEVQELITLSASANKLSKLKEQAQEYAALIMEELDPENLGYIELWQLETLLLRRDAYMNYSRPLSTTSVGWSQNLTAFRPQNMARRLSYTLRCIILENWQRGWILTLWLIVMTLLFTWKFVNYRNRAAFQVMGYCLATAKGAAETLKLNMALILFPVCRNTITWLRSTKARTVIPFDDNINFHKMIAVAIAIGVTVHAGNHLVCDFPRLTNASSDKFALIASHFDGKKPTYRDLLSGVEGLTGISMVVLMAIAFTLATSQFRRNVVKLPSPFNRLTGFNAFWYSHHLTGVVYILLFVHGTFLYLTDKWYDKNTWMYLSLPLLLYVIERTIRTCRSEHQSAKIIRVTVLPGDVFSLTMSKPQGFKYKSGQYIFLQCPSISPFEWHPFSITSAPGDEYLSVHIRIVGDWTQGLKQVFTEVNDSPTVIGRAKFGQLGHMDHRGQPKLYVDGPYGAPAQDYKNYDVLLLVGLGIGATPFISILRDLLNNTRTTDSNTDTSRSDYSSNSYASSSATGGSTIKKKTLRTTNAHFYWVTREPGSFEWFKGVMDEVAEMDHKGQIEMHNYLTSVYEEGDARSTLITMVQALNHAKHGIDIVSGTRVRTHFARPNWREVFTKIASKHPFSTIGVFYCGMPMLAKELKKLSQDMSHRTSTRFEFHKEYF
ncbi:Respiratory burst oxidase homolog protein E [Linum perenne]